MQQLIVSPVAMLCITALLLAVVILGRRIELRIGSLHAELRPNGGSTLRDAIDRIEQRVATLERIEFERMNTTEEPHQHG